MTTLGHTAIAALFGGLVFAAFEYAGTARWFAVALRRRTLRAFGKYSYAMYVLHFAIAVYLARFAVARSPSLSRLGQAALWLGSVSFGILLTFGLALRSWNPLEKHFLALKKYFVAEAA